MTDFESWFLRLTGTAMPYGWQSSLAVAPAPRSRLVRIPTGMGKTLGVLAAWTWHRVHHQNDAWPRRLVWCLPTRVLVEQTRDVVKDALGRLDVLWDGSTDHAGKVGVHLLMGGADPGGDWNLYPEEASVLIGTQDMLLSRALNRGYATGRARWPLEFGLVSHDALWVMDEVQLMDVGLATSAQLQAFHDKDLSKGFRPRHTWWMSATLQPVWLKSVDTEIRYEDWVSDQIAIPLDQRGKGLGSASKGLSLASIEANDATAMARRALDEHLKLADSEHGRITLVVCNTVERACETFDALSAQTPRPRIELVHSRFRAAERVVWRQNFLSRDACVSGADRIIVATQVVEAGVDISAGCLVTDLAPWASLVQRFGRCARYGGRGVAIVVDRGRDERDALPYTTGELEAARSELEKVDDVGLARLEAFESALDSDERKTLFPYEPRHLLLRREFDELFDTTPDLTGADLDISRFIRSGSERDLQVFWVDIPKDQKGRPNQAPNRRRRPLPDELCAVPFLSARDWLCGEQTKAKRKTRLRPAMRAWVWDWLDGAWIVAERPMLTPGRIVCVASDSGGYRAERGFDSTSEARVPLVVRPPLPLAVKAELQADDSEGAEDLSAADWKTIGCHVTEVTNIAAAIATATHLPTRLRAVLLLAARWHDLGKAHPAFQGAIRRIDRPDRQDVAKAPSNPINAWLRPPGNYRTADDRDLRPGFRHELASALGLFAVLRFYQPRHPALLGPWVETLQLIGHLVPDAAVGSTPTPYELEVLACSAEDFDLLAYLVASHHGKVRVALHASPKDQDYRDLGDGRGLPIRGVREGDVLPAITLDGTTPPLPSLRLSLEPASLGLSVETGRSWRERTLDLVGRFGPGALAWLEALLVAADRRASRMTTIDPALAYRELPR